MLKLDNILVYHWHAWKGFLISHLVADYCRVEASYEDNINDVEPYLTPNIRAVLFQINLSNSAFFPVHRQELMHVLNKRNIHVLNAGITDITKRNLYYLLDKAGLKSTKAQIAGPADEMLFIKSNLNCGGVAEQRLPETLQKQLLPGKAPILGRGDDYFMLKRSDISFDLWSDAHIVIENYIHNTENSFYRVYGFGESLVIVKAHSNALIKKISGHSLDSNIFTTKQHILSKNIQLPAALKTTINTFIAHYPIAYFCLDIVHDTKDYYIIDLNLTPYAGIDEQNRDALTFLTEGAHHHIAQLQRGEFMHL